jgi:hypothetical protein
MVEFFRYDVQAQQLREEYPAFHVYLQKCDINDNEHFDQVNRTGKHYICGVEVVTDTGVRNESLVRKVE